MQYIVSLDDIMKSKKHLESLKRGLHILTCISNEKKALTLTELSKLTGLHKATLQRYLNTLFQLGYLYFVNNKKYRISLKVLKLGYSVIKNYDIREQLSPYLKNLSNSICQTVNLSKLLDKEIVLLERFEVKRVVNYEISVGSFLPIHCTTSGKAIIAFLPTNQIKHILNNISFEKFTKYTITDKNEFMKELEEIRKKGYALQNQEFSLNSRSTGAPIFSRNDKVEAAISIVVNASDYSIDEFEKKFSPIVVETANRLSYYKL